MFDPKEPEGSLKRMRESNRNARIEQLTQQPAILDELNDGDTSCAIRNFFRNQQNLPPEMRQNYCHISCPCKLCKPCM